MNKILYTILISVFSLTIISCSKKEESKSSSSSSGTTTTTTDTTAPSVFVSVSNSGNIVRSTDNGSSWDNATSPTSNHLYGVTGVTFSESIYTDNGTTFKVTVSGGKYYLDGTQTKSLNLKKGYTYYFDSSDSSTNSHPFYIGTTSGGGNYTGEYTSGVTSSRTTTGTLTFIVPSDSPTTLYYNCGNHSGMGGTITFH